MDVLTTAASIADILGAPEIVPLHLLQALDILEGRATIHDLGRPRSLLGRSARAATSPAVAALAQRWWAQLGGEHAAPLAGPDRDTFEAEVRAATSAS